MFNPLFALGTAAWILIGIGVLAAVLIVMAISAYNGLVVLRNRYKNAYSQIDVQLKRRYDLIPNLVETVKGYMAHERETLEAVIEARNMAINANQKAAADPGNPEAMQQLAAAEGQLGSFSAGAGGVLGRLFALSEAYPDLKANQNMANLQEELTSTENKVAFSRQAYNDAVMAFNNGRDVFPTVIFANLFGFTSASHFELDSPKEREAPKVSFS